RFLKGTAHSRGSLREGRRYAHLLILHLCQRKWIMMTYLPSLSGGMLLGLSAVLLYAANGRIAGISGIFGRLLAGYNMASNIAFVIGLIAGPFLYVAVYGQLPAMVVLASWPLVIFAGLFVGIGTRMGSGCTSGHGIMGLA